MRTILNFVLYFMLYHSVCSQEQIKQLIYEDLLLMNNIHNGCIIQSTQNRVRIEANDTITQLNTMESIEQDWHRVNLVNVHRVNGYYFVEAKFDLIADIRYLGLFSDNTFRYTLFEMQGRFLKVNGFLVSEILDLSRTELPQTIAKNAKLKVSRGFGTHLRKRRVERISEELSVSVLEEIFRMGFELNYRPYVKDSYCG